MFDDIRGGKKAVTAQSTQNTPVIAAKSELTSAPEVGTILADILIDKSKGAYNADGSVNRDNLTDFYKKSYVTNFGQCTWYASGRLYETKGINIVSAPNQINGKGLENWVDEAMSGDYANITGTTDVAAITQGSIAVWENHVVFVEYVEHDNSNNPSNIYFTEANTGNDGKYRPGQDAKVQKLSFERFVNRDNRSPLLGYVMVK